MRAREMHNKLDKLSGSVDDDEHTCPDISLLSPEDQDRVHEILAKFKGAKGEQEISAKIEENVVTVAELNEMFGLWAGLPRLGPGDGFRGPSYEIPPHLCSYFTHFRRRENEGVHPQFDFPKLKAVQKVRFVELCRKYGWQGEYPDPVRHRRCNHWKHRDSVRLLPFSEWDPEDETELRSLLDVAEV
jgi:hypothetical protein